MSSLLSLLAGCHLAIKSTPADDAGVQPTGDDATGVISWKDDGAPHTGAAIAARSQRAGVDSLTIMGAVPGTEINFGLLSAHELAPGTFPCSTSNTQDPIVILTYASYGATLHGEAMSCTITLSQLGASAVGTFSAIVGVEGGGTAPITAGTFDVPVGEVTGPTFDASVDQAPSGDGGAGVTITIPAQSSMKIVFDQTTTVFADSVQWDYYNGSVPRLQAFKGGNAIVTLWPMGIATGTQPLAAQGLYWSESWPTIFTVDAKGGTLSLNNDGDVLGGTFSATGQMYPSGAGPESTIDAVFTGVRKTTP